jgi:hypothetical protein
LSVFAYCMAMLRLNSKPFPYASSGA